MQDQKQKYSRREFLKKSLGGLGAVTLGNSFLKGKKKDQQKKPNIIFLLTDDQRWDTLGCMGNEIIKTPNMDDLAHEGTLFKNAFVTTSICVASRASILTGQYERRHGCVDFGSSPNNKMTYPLILKDKGYRIGFIGKYGVGNPPINKFDYWNAIVHQPKYEHTDENGNYKHYTKICQENALEFLDYTNDDRPFCLSVSFKSPHVQDRTTHNQFIFDPEYKNLYKDVKIPTPKTGADKYFHNKFPDWFTESNEARRRWSIRFSTPERYQESVKGYYRLIYGVDVTVGKIRQKLKEIGEAKNTVIIFMGDNGFYLGEHGMAGKWYGHEESIRVPLIIYDPRLPKPLKGKECSKMSLNIDIAPTLLKLAGVSVPDFMQGKSLLPLIEGKSPSWRNQFFYEQLFSITGESEKFDWAENIYPTEGVRTTRYKYLKYPGHEFEELYDLNKDPNEINNLAQNDKFKNLLEKMRDKSKKLLQKAK